MKGGSQRLLTADTADDWGDGSWTVDCICGVDFDDGEEMVKCDVCGVWVHTRCSRYVKSEESFACDKCKSKGVVRNDSEEKQVAKLLVGLPIKTMREASSCGNNSGVQSKGLLRLWAEIPMEEKVHVQGIPGGDLTLFSGLPSVFSPPLWECAGYVPKKFSFQYREFPCWDDDKKENTVVNVDQDKENSPDRGAGVLFSLSNENLNVNPVGSLFGIGGSDEEWKYERKGHLRGCDKWEAVDMDVRHLQNVVKKNRSLLRPIVIQTGKRKKEVPIVLKDLAGKKRARFGDGKVDEKRRTLLTSRTVFTTTSDAKRLELCEDRGPKSFNIDLQSVKNVNSRDSVPSGSLSCGHVDPGVSELLGKPVDASGVTRLKGSFSAKNEDNQQKLYAIGGTKVVSSCHQHPEPAFIQKTKLGESVSSEKPDGSTGGRGRKATEECPASPCLKITVDSSGPDINSNNQPVVLQHNAKTELELDADDVVRIDNMESSFQAPGNPIQSTDHAEVGANAAKIPENLCNADVDGSCLVSVDIKSSETRGRGIGGLCCSPGKSL